MLFLDMLVLLRKLPLPHLTRLSYFQEYNHYIHQQCRVRILTKLITVKFVSCLIAFEYETLHNGRFSPATQLYLQSILRLAPVLIPVNLEDANNEILRYKK